MGTTNLDALELSGALTSASVATTGPVTQTASSTLSGTVGTPASGTVTATEERFGSLRVTTFTLTAAQVAITDAAGSGSHGSLKLYDFPEGALVTLGSRQDYTAFAEGAALTGAAGDAVFEIGLGSTAISAAADGTLGATEDDIGGDVNVTLSAGTGTGTAVTGAAGGFNGTATALDLNLNVSGTAATIDATSTLDVTGTITVAWLTLGDD